jgi:hypothetical protein
MAQQEADSKKTLREKQMEELAQKIQFNPVMNQAHLNLMGAQEHNADVRSQYWPEDVINQRTKLRNEAISSGDPQMTMPPKLTSPMPPPARQQLPSLMPRAESQNFIPQEILQTATQFLNKQNRNPQDGGTIPTDSGPSLPSTHTYKVRNRYTGQMGYANENGLKDPDWEVVHE